MFKGPVLFNFQSQFQALSQVDRRFFTPSDDRKQKYWQEVRPRLTVNQKNQQFIVQGQIKQFAKQPTQPDKNLPWRTDPRLRALLDLQQPTVPQSIIFKPKP